MDTCCEDCTPATAANPDERWLRNARFARWLAWASLAWMTAEGIVGLIAGFAAGSIALVGWALGSGISEGLISVIVVWRFTGSRTLSDTAERRAQEGRRRQLLAAGPLHRDRSHPRPDRASPSQRHAAGIALTASSLVIMPILSIAKRRLGERPVLAPQPGRHPEPDVRRPGRRGPARPGRGRRLAGQLANRPHHRARHRCLVGLGRKPVLARRRLLLTRRDQGADESRSPCL
jgi:hypothetical protein